MQRRSIIQEKLVKNELGYFLFKKVGTQEKKVGTHFKKVGT